MLNILQDVDEAVAPIHDGATVMIGGFGKAGQPVELIEALLRQGAKDLTVVNNNAGNGEEGLAALIGAAASGRLSAPSPASPIPRFSMRSSGPGRSN